MKKTKLLLCLAAISLVLAGCGKKKGGEGGDEGGGEVTPTYTYKMVVRSDNIDITIFFKNIFKG